MHLNQLRGFCEVLLCRRLLLLESLLLCSFLFLEPDLLFLGLGFRFGSRFLLLGGCQWLLFFFTFLAFLFLAFLVVIILILRLRVTFLLLSLGGFLAFAFLGRR